MISEDDVVELEQEAREDLMDPEYRNNCPKRRGVLDCCSDCDRYMHDCGGDE